MLRITRQADYAIRCIMYLCKNKDKISMVDEIVKEMHIPKSFLAKILQKLSRAKIVKSYRGVKGGFTLIKNPKDITLLDVIEIIDGTVVINICAVNKKMCILSDKCAVHPVWIKLKAETEDKLSKVDFESLCAAQNFNLETALSQK